MSVKTEQLPSPGYSRGYGCEREVLDPYDPEAEPTARDLYEAFLRESTAELESSPIGSSKESTQEIPSITTTTTTTSTTDEDTSEADLGHLDITYTNLSVSERPTSSHTTATRTTTADDSSIASHNTSLIADLTATLSASTIRYAENDQALHQLMDNYHHQLKTLGLDNLPSYSQRFASSTTSLVDPHQPQPPPMTLEDMLAESESWINPKKKPSKRLLELQAKQRQKEKETQMIINRALWYRTPEWANRGEELLKQWESRPDYTTGFPNSSTTSIETAGAGPAGFNGAGDEQPVGERAWTPGDSDAQTGDDHIRKLLHEMSFGRPETAAEKALREDEETLAKIEKGEFVPPQPFARHIAAGDGKVWNDGAEVLTEEDHIRKLFFDMEHGVHDDPRLKDLEKEGLNLQQEMREFEERCWKRRKEEEERLEKIRKEEEEKRRKEEEERQRLIRMKQDQERREREAREAAARAKEEKRRKEEEAARAAVERARQEQQRKIQEQQARIKAEADKKAREESERRQREEAQRKRAEDERRRQGEEKKKADDERRRQQQAAEDNRRQQEAAAAAAAEAERKKKEQAAAAAKTGAAGVDPDIQKWFDGEGAKWTQQAQVSMRYLSDERKNKLFPAIKRVSDYYAASVAKNLTRARTGAPDMDATTFANLRTSLTNGATFEADMQVTQLKFKQLKQHFALPETLIQGRAEINKKISQLAGTKHSYTRSATELIVTLKNAENNNDPATFKYVLADDLITSELPLKDAAERDKYLHVQVVILMYFAIKSVLNKAKAESPMDPLLVKSLAMAMNAFVGGKSKFLDTLPLTKLLRMRMWEFCPEVFGKAGDANEVSDSGNNNVAEAVAGLFSLMAIHRWANIRRIKPFEVSDLLTSLQRILALPPKLRNEKHYIILRTIMTLAPWSIREHLASLPALESLCLSINKFCLQDSEPDSKLKTQASLLRQHMINLIAKEQYGADPASHFGCDELRYWDEADVLDSWEKRKGLAGEALQGDNLRRLEADKAATRARMDKERELRDRQAKAGGYAEG